MKRKLIALCALVLIAASLAGCSIGLYVPFWGKTTVHCTREYDGEGNLYEIFAYSRANGTKGEVTIVLSVKPAGGMAKSMEGVAMTLGAEVTVELADGTTLAAQALSEEKVVTGYYPQFHPEYTFTLSEEFDQKIESLDCTHYLKTTTGLDVYLPSGDE